MVCVEQLTRELGMHLVSGEIPGKNLAVNGASHEHLWFCPTYRDPGVSHELGSDLMTGAVHRLVRQSYHRLVSAVSASSPDVHMSTYRREYVRVLVLGIEYFLFCTTL